MITGQTWSDANFYLFHTGIRVILYSEADFKSISFVSTIHQKTWRNWFFSKLCLWMRVTMMQMKISLKIWMRMRSILVKWSDANFLSISHPGIWFIKKFGCGWGCKCEWYGWGWYLDRKSLGVHPSQPDTEGNLRDHWMLIRFHHTKWIVRLYCWCYQYKCQHRQTLICLIFTLLLLALELHTYC